jgi:transcriptional regulator GlxA family with amidase domain
MEEAAVSTPSDRVEALVGRRVRVTLAWIDEGTSQRREFVGTVSGAFLLGRAGFLVLDAGAIAVESSRIVSVEEVADAA